MQLLTMEKLPENLAECYPNQLFFTIDQETEEIAWKQAQKYSYPVARWNAYLNILVVEYFVEYLQEEAQIKEKVEVCFNDLLEANQKYGSSLGEFINGSAIQLGDIRLILIPDDSNITDEFCIQKEWVDIAELAGDYYLAAEVNLDEKYIRIWGYTTHQKIKQKAEYDSSDRYYIMEEDDLIEDINVMWMAQELKFIEKAKIAQTISLSSAEKVSLIKKLGKPTPYSPRLDVDFPKWAALLVDNNPLKLLQSFANPRLQLCEMRGCLIPQVAAAKAAIASSVAIEPNLEDILRWIQTTLNTMCDSVEAIFRNNSPQMIPVADFRAIESLPDGFQGIKEINIASSSIKITKILGVNKTSKALNIVFDVSSTDANIHLPKGLEVQALNQENEVISTLKAEENYSNLRLNFKRQFGEPFTVKLFLASGEEIQTFEYK